MTLKLKLQPKDSLTCGQHCIAMIVNTSPSDAIRTFGTDKGTHTKQLVRALYLYGWDSDSRLRRINRATVLPRLCILKIIYPWRPRNGHWVVYCDGWIYCPGNGIYHIDEHKPFLEGNISSYLEIYNSVPCALPLLE